MRRFRNVLFSAVMVLGVLFIGVWLLYLYALRPEIAVSGPSTQVTIYRTGTDTITRQSATAHSFRLSPGTYTVEVATQNGGIVARNYTLGLHQKGGFVLPAAAAPVGSFEPVSSVPALETTIQQGALYYLDTTTQSFNSTSATGLTKMLLPAGSIHAGAGNASESEVITQISPLPRGQELLLSSSNTTYVWSSGGIKPLSMVGINTTNLNQQQVLFGTNPLNNSFVVSVGGEVYQYKTTDSDPVLVASLKTRFNRLVFGGGKFLAFDTTMPYSSTDLKPSYSQKYLIYPVLADTTSMQSFQLGQVLVDASISPDGRHMVAKFRQQSDASLYAIAGPSLKLNLVSTILRPSVLAPLWISSSSFVYANNTTIWHYETDGQFSTAVVRDLPAPPSSLSLQPDGSIIYTALSETGRSAAYQIKNSASAHLDSKTAKQLTAFLSSGAVNTAAYSWVYTDITAPTFFLTLTYPPGNSNPTVAQAIASFEGYMHHAGLNPQSFIVTARYNPAF